MFLFFCFCFFLLLASATETNKPQKLFFISFSFQILLKELVKDSFLQLMMNNKQKLEQNTFITLLITHNAIIYLVQSERQRNRSQLIKYYWESWFCYCYHLVNVNSLTIGQSDHIKRHITFKTILSLYLSSILFDALTSSSSSFILRIIRLWKLSCPPNVRHTYLSCNQKYFFSFRQVSLNETRIFGEVVKLKVDKF